MVKLNHERPELKLKDSILKLQKSEENALIGKLHISLSADKVDYRSPPSPYLQDWYSVSETVRAFTAYHNSRIAVEVIKNREQNGEVIGKKILKRCNLLEANGEKITSLLEPVLIDIFLFSASAGKEGNKAAFEWITHFQYYLLHSLDVTADAFEKTLDAISIIFFEILKNKTGLDF